MDWKQVFEGKKITVAGLGLLGRSAGDAAFLAENGAELIVTDLKHKDELAVSLKRLKRYPNITYRLGGHDEADFTGRDFILKGPAVPTDSPYIAAARKAGIPIKMSASWFAELAKIPVVGITGTRGKTTVTYMLRNIMQAAGMQVIIGGNVRGVSTLSLLESVTKDSIALLELDSWQLQGFGEARMSPNIAVFTTFYPDHLDYYRGDMDAYLADKAQIFLNQEASDTLIVGAQAHDIVAKAYGKAIRSKVVVADPEHFPKNWTLRVPGAHNRANAALALESARTLGIDDDISRRALEAFGGVPGRLELVREVAGVKFYNDTTATTPEATIAALKALDTGNKNIVLILGGADKDLVIDTLLKEVDATCKATALLAGTGTGKVTETYKLKPGTEPFNNLKDAFEAAVEIAKEGDTVLLSPAFASFGMFKNEFDRGEQFNALVKAL
ncbi:MAG: UDP-N-acetylmuramoyl-L-alanine--D-glutamate ligase [Candidatus Paceibacteria bacterium]